MMPTHHPGDDLLIAYAAGSQEEPVALIVATHLALCPRCRAEVARLEALGGTLMESRESAPLAEDSVERMLARLDEPAPEVARRAPEAAPDLLIPRPLRDYLGAGFEALSWRSYPGRRQIDLLPEAKGFRTRLMRFRPGASLPEHAHAGSELTLVLTGGFTDEVGHFLRGDLSEADASVAHRPVADPGEDCICLAVSDGPMRLTGPLGRLINPFLRS